jgi:DNA-binding CsgD family transcriptional regulator
MGRGRECDRDELGRRIPRLNTKSAQIYALKLAGVSNVAIARKLNMTAAAVGVLWHGIRYPELKNRRWYAWRLEKSRAGK